MLVVGAPLRHRHRIYNAAVVIHRGARARRGAEVVPADLSGVLRAPSDRAGRRRARRHPRSANVEVPFGPDLLFAATDVPGFVLHVEICEDMFVPIPPSAEAALAGATVLANLSGSPITIGRAEDRCLLARSASSRCLAAYVYAAAGKANRRTDLAWDGQTMMCENGACLANPSASPRGATQRRRRRHRTASLGAAPDGHLRRQPASPPDDGASRSGASSSGWIRRPATSDCAATSSVSLRPRRSATAGTGLLRGVQHPGRPGSNSDCVRWITRRSSSGSPVGWTRPTR